MPGADPLAGATIGARYTLAEKIGEGGMGVVYRAEDTTTGEPVAVKLLLPEFGRIGSIAQRFEREEQAIGRLRHQHVVRVVDCGKLESGALYLVMELLEGESLADVIAAKGRLPLKRAIGIMRQILSALDHAHGQGVIHRDLKPENVVLLRGDFVKLLDFGIAKIRDDSSDSEMIKLTQAGLALGTPDYISPEQAGGLEVDARTDIYACGVLLFEMLTGRRPFVATRAVDLMIMHTSKPAPSPRATAPDAGITEALDGIVLRALEKDPARRFPSAGSFLQALEQPEPVPADYTAPSWPRRAWRTCTYALDRVWRAFWNAPRIMSLRVRTRLWWVTQPSAIRRGIPIAVLALWVIGIGIVGFTLKRSHPPETRDVVVTPSTTEQPAEAPLPPPAHKAPKPKRHHAKHER
jgi:serine/threonine-protein kinase